jgi:hypothetical protein
MNSNARNYFAERVRRRKFDAADIASAVRSGP